MSDRDICVSDNTRLCAIGDLGGAAHLTSVDSGSGLDKVGFSGPCRNIVVSLYCVLRMDLPLLILFSRFRRTTVHRIWLD